MAKNRKTWRYRGRKRRSSLVVPALALTALIGTGLAITPVRDACKQVVQKGLHVVQEGDYGSLLDGARSLDFDLSSGRGRLHHPLGDANYVLTGAFKERRGWRRHAGEDYLVPRGTPVYSPANGTITELYDSFIRDTQRGIKQTSKQRNNGNYLFIQHDEGNRVSKMLHFFDLDDALEPGSRVRRGQYLGSVGSTGRSSGPHLHYELHENGVAVKPSRYFI